MYYRYGRNYDIIVLYNYIDKYEFNREVIEIVFKSVKYLERLVLEESSNSNVNDISFDIGKFMDTYKVVLVIMYIILFYI